MCDSEVLPKLLRKHANEDFLGAARECKCDNYVENILRAKSLRDLLELYLFIYFVVKTLREEYGDTFGKFFPHMKKFFANVAKEYRRRCGGGR